MIAQQRQHAGHERRLQQGRIAGGHEGAAGPAAESVEAGLHATQWPFAFHLIPHHDGTVLFRHLLSGGGHHDERWPGAGSGCVGGICRQSL